ncbi:hypothetical protein AVEN_50987-1 [Araneus ventricosus]|uniref:Uncharacterized protein n=1 Tax=Araneus ventricosus TaxID=182803 RepID=A0A4Y2CW08_ARAVE|nr:hypothetical protein AVEN_50987-1 [Araneus ventricosus]
MLQNATVHIKAYIHTEQWLKGTGCCKVTTVHIEACIHAEQWLTAHDVTKCHRAYQGMHSRRTMAKRHRMLRNDHYTYRGMHSRCTMADCRGCYSVMAIRRKT